MHPMRLAAETLCNLMSDGSKQTRKGKKKKKDEALLQKTRRHLNNERTARAVFTHGQSSLSEFDKCPTTPGAIGGC